MRVVLLLLTALAAHTAAAQGPSGVVELPEWARAAFQADAFVREYRPSAWLDPSLLPGDFDGDGRADVAVLVARRDTGARGIAVLHAGSATPVVVGAGHAIGNGGDDFSWMDAWSVYPKRAAPRESGAATPRLAGDALLVEKLESASALLYWDGSAYRWHQQGD